VTDHLLARIPGGYIARALQNLPPAAKAEDGALMDCFVNVPEIGPVRITAKRFKHNHGRSTHYFGTTERAVGHSRVVGKPL